MILVFTKVDVCDGQEGNFEQLVAQLSAQSLKHEPGCHQYNLCKTTEHENYVIIETYDSQEALEAHRSAEYFQSARPALAECISGTQRHQMKVLV